MVTTVLHFDHGTKSATTWKHWLFILGGRLSKATWTMRVLLLLRLVETATDALCFFEVNCKAFPFLYHPSGEAGVVRLLMSTSCATTVFFSSAMISPWLATSFSRASNLSSLWLACFTPVARYADGGKVGGDLTQPPAMDVVTAEDCMGRTSVVARSFQDLGGMPFHDLGGKGRLGAIVPSGRCSTGGSGSLSLDLGA